MKNEKPTLIILTPGFPSDETDSTCLPLLQIFLNSLKENFQKINIIVLTFHYPYYKGIYYWNGIQVISFNGRNRRKLFRLLLWYRIIKKLEKLHKKNNILGILSLWCNECAWVGKKFSRKKNLNHFCWLWGQDARKGNKYVKRIKPSANELIALSDFLQSEFEKNYLIRPAYVIPPGIDARNFHFSDKLKDIDILGVGSLIPLKQYNIFIDIVAKIKTFLPGVRVILCGKGLEEENLQQQITSLKLNNNISLIGEIPHHEVLQIMQRSKILLHTSSYEGFGQVCQEALFAGAYVISFCKPMNKEIKNWYIVKNGEEMADKVREILKFSSENYEPVKMYNINDIAKEIMTLFNYKEEMA